MQKTLLVVDDAGIVREKIKEAARGAGWEIVGEACNGLEAIERYATLRPAVMTLDLFMPRYDGIYAMREIFTMDPAAKVIVVSAIAQRAILKEAFQLGPAGFVMKPFEKSTLIGTLEQIASLDSITSMTP